MMRQSALPGFIPTFAVTLLWLSLIVLVPLAALILRPWELGIAGVWDEYQSKHGKAAASKPKAKQPRPKAAATAADAGATAE